MFNRVGNAALDDKKLTDEGVLDGTMSEIITNGFYKFSFVAEDEVTQGLQFSFARGPIRVWICILIPLIFLKVVYTKKARTEDRALNYYYAFVFA
jgi:hypothetical protein